jgi:hypothetical protein
MRVVIDNFMRMLFLGVLYLAFVQGIEGVLNMALLYVWVMVVVGILMGVFVILLHHVDAARVAELEYGKSPRWSYRIGIAYWVVVSLLFAFHGHLVTSTFILISTFFLAVSRDLINLSPSTIEEAK